MANTKNPEEPSSSQEHQDSHESRKPKRNTSNSDNTRAAKRPSPMEVLRQARGQLAELTGMEAESVTSFEQTEEGWALEVEVLELERVPDTMSLMASYQVELDSDGQLTGYRRVRRYERGRSDARRPGGR
ncbi:gas vesicle protein [Streptomyces sp. 15-116A]|uniref:gas vesicle protein GvpO n=1 Tax=Streptomyces sp. 15-116A TaxID=2259035 RepID=UPI0021B28712|nr:gas vesicle protein [Streptomyces sp. 15-116A]MCT7353673.1 gas vesicle protein [Streptomyces sp. 15-116A]